MKLKILQVCPRYYPDIGGVETHVKEISERLVRVGFEVEVVCTDPSGKHQKEEIINGVKVKRFRSLAPNDNYFFATQIYFYLKKVRCDIIHAHNYHTLLPLFAAFARKGRIFMFTPHTFGFPTTFPGNLLHKAYKAFGKMIFNSADKIITVSKEEEKWINNVFQVPENRLHYIPLPIVIGNSNVGASKENIVKIAFVGRLSEEKNVELLISAFALVKQAHSESELFIVGNGPLRNQLENISTQINDVNFMGALVHDEVLRFLDEIDLFILPSHFEVLGISVLEAMSKRIPVILTPVGELQHTLKHEVNCLFTKIDDVNDLANNISMLMEDHGLAKRIAENGRRYVEERHDINKIINDYIDMYNEIGGGK
ncbi:MAG: glycosyltransferase family 4 protein [Candidatus Peribacteraceae bacterium]|nr:glycosyltransferase family 4 protein [Candidatus Peribacteraceae bacterium]